MSEVSPASSASLPRWQKEDLSNTKKKNRSYSDYILVQLRHRFSQVDTQFQKLERHLGEALPAEEHARFSTLLTATQQGLESKNPPLLELGMQILELEKDLLELLPDPYLEPVAQALKTKLELEQDPQAQKLQEVMTTQTDPALRPAALRTTMRQLIHIRSLSALKKHIDSTNRLRRFKDLRSLLGVLALFILVVSPLLFRQIEAFWQDSLLFRILEPLLPQAPAEGETYFQALLISATVMLMGALGGYLAGLFSGFKKDENVLQDNADRLLTAIRPALGALFAVLFYLFLDWEIIPGLSIDNAGTVIFISFLMGFSARFAMGIFGKVVPGLSDQSGTFLTTSTATPTDQVADSDTGLLSGSFSPPPAAPPSSFSPEGSAYPPTAYPPAPSPEPFPAPEDNLQEQGPVNPSL